MVFVTRVENRLFSSRSQCLQVKICKIPVARASVSCPGVAEYFFRAFVSFVMAAVEPILILFLVDGMGIGG